MGFMPEGVSFIAVFSAVLLYVVIVSFGLMMDTDMSSPMDIFEQYPYTFAAVVLIGVLGNVVVGMAVKAVSGLESEVKKEE